MTDAQREYQREYRAKNRERLLEKRAIWLASESGVRSKQKVREQRLLNRYGVSMERYAAMLKQNNGGCHICGGPPIGKGSTSMFAVDHDHTTGAIRGLLCLRCNTLLGSAKDNVDVLRKAISYLEK